jgi:hypothetical protein
MVWVLFLWCGSNSEAYSGVVLQLYLNNSFHSLASYIPVLWKKLDSSSIVMKFPFLKNDHLWFSK